MDFLSCTGLEDINADTINVYNTLNVQNNDILASILTISGEILTISGEINYLYGQTYNFQNNFILKKTLPINFALFKKYYN